MTVLLKWTYSLALTLICGYANYDAQAITCYECTSIDGDCSSGICTGKFCIARIVQSQSPNNNIFTKECSSTNPNSLKTVGCMTSSVGGTTAVSCACTTDYCNSRQSIDDFLDKNVTRTNSGDVYSLQQKGPILDDNNVDGNFTNNNTVSFEQDSRTKVGDENEDLNELLVSCYECNSVTGDCAIGNCKGHWCKTSISEDSAAGTKVVSKGCSKSHPNTVAYDGCVEVKSQTVTTVSCGCRRSNFCNTAENVRSWLSSSSTGNDLISVANNSDGSKLYANFKRRCHCTAGSRGCAKGMCLGEICAKTEQPEYGNSKSIQYCVFGDGVEIGCRKGAREKSSIQSIEIGVSHSDISPSAQTCFCNQDDFCNKSSINFPISFTLYLLSLAVYTVTGIL